MGAHEGERREDQGHRDDDRQFDLAAGTDRAAQILHSVGLQFRIDVGQDSFLLSSIDGGTDGSGPAVDAPGLASWLAGVARREIGWGGKEIRCRRVRRSGSRARCRIARQRVEGLAVESAGNAVANVFAARGVNLVRPWIRSPGIGQGGEGRLLDRIGWILLGVLLGSSCASIALTFFSRSSGGNPGLPSWTPGGGTTFFLSDYIRMQVDPFLIIAAVCGVIAAGWKLVTQQEGRDLIPLGKAFMWAILSAVCLAGLVNTFQATFDTWTADVLRSASGMMNDAWESKSLAASSFFNLGAPVAIVLTIVMWICGLISKIFAYFRAGMLPILVGVAPMWAAMSWMETGKQAFAKTIGWLAAFLAYKPVAALVMATGSAIMATAGPGDDSQAITLMLTLSVIILLPAMIRVIVPAVQSSVGGGGGGILPSILGMGVALAGAGVRKAAGGKGGRKGGGDGRGEASPDGARPGAGRGLAGLLSGLGRNGGKPQGANGGGRHAKPLDGNPTGGEPQNIGDKPQGANRKGSDGKPQGANGNGAGSPVPPAPDGASPDPSGGNRPQGANGDAGGFAREGAPDGADRSTTRKGKTF